MALSTISSSVVEAALHKEFASASESITNPTIAAKFTEWIDVWRFQDKLFFFRNDTPQTLTLQLQSRPDTPASATDGTGDIHDIGSTFTIATTAKEFKAYTDAHRWIRFKVTSAADVADNSVLSVKARLQTGVA